MKTFTVFPGNCPHNVAKDAKYSVRGTDGRVGIDVFHCERGDAGTCPLTPTLISLTW